MSQNVYDSFGESNAVGSKSTTRRQRILGLLANGLLLTASLALALSAGELLLRVFPEYQIAAGDGEYAFCGPIKTRNQPHPLFGHTEIPGNSYFERFSRQDPWNYVHINDQGFRDNETVSDRSVFVLGDSMVRGSLVGEHETFVHLLNIWQPHFSFLNFGIGGYGQANTVRLYEAKSGQIPHSLVIQAVSLGTDIEDNVERAVLTQDSVEITVKASTSSPADVSVPVRVHLALWHSSKLYRLAYSTALQPFLGNRDSRRDMDHALEVTRRLLDRLADDAHERGADLLLLAIPSWAEIAGRDDGLQPDRQRQMLREFVASKPGTYLVDPTTRLLQSGADWTYGVVDKHLTPYGHFLVADELEKWLTSQWPNGPREIRPDRSFVHQPPTIPDCSHAAGYLAALKTS